MVTEETKKIIAEEWEKGTVFRKIQKMTDLSVTDFFYVVYGELKLTPRPRGGRYDRKDRTTCIVHPSGRFVLPKDIRMKLGFKAGQILKWELLGDQTLRVTSKEA